MEADWVIDSIPKLGRYLEMISNQITRANGAITDPMNFVNPGASKLAEADLEAVLKETQETMVTKETITISQHYPLPFTP